MKQSNFGVVFTVKDEEDLISQALDYYFYMGASKVWCFLDGSTDSTEAIVRGYDNVECRSSISPEEVEADLPWIREVMPRWKTNMDVRKRINAYHAARSACQDGIEWLLAIDPDEIVFFNRGAVEVARGEITDRLRDIPEHIDQLLLQNLEAIPHMDCIDNPFMQCFFFTRRHNWLQFFNRGLRYAMRKLGFPAALQDVVENILWNVRFLFQLKRVYQVPKSGKRIWAGYYYGYINYKPLIRSRVAVYANFDTHKWIGRGGVYAKSLHNQISGQLLHYDFYSSSNVRKKFSKRTPNLRSNGKHFRNEIARLACELDEEEFSAFFRGNLVQKHMASLLRLGAIQKIDFVHNVFESIAAQKNA